MAHFRLFMAIIPAVFPLFERIDSWLSDRYSDSAMHFLTRAGYRSIMPLSAALLLAGGPVVFSAQSHCQKRAAAEVARQKAANESAGSQGAAEGLPTEAPPTQERDGSASFLAAGTKPVDTQGAGLVLGLVAHARCDAGLRRPGGVVADATPLFAATLHCPCYQAQAPPIA